MQEALEEAKKEEERLQAEAEAKQLALEKAEAERLERVLFARNQPSVHSIHTVMHII